MAIDFPASPTVGQVFIFGTTTYIWDGTKWTSSAANSPFSLGNASTPSITFIGDTNTGIYSPGADQVSITTGGTERVRFDSTGQLESVSLGTAAAPAFSFTTDPDTGLYSPGANQVAISTGGSGRLFVDSSGNVGVGTSGPQRRFHIVGSDGAVASFPTIGGKDFLVVENNGNASISIIAGATSASALKYFANAATSDSGSISYTHSTGILDIINKSASGSTIFYTNSTERLRITSAGLVGIGTSSPSYRIDVNNTGGGTGGIRLLSADQSTTRIRLENTGASGRSYEIVGGLTGVDNSTFSIYDATASATRFAIDSSGRVGIGTTSPGNPLHVSGTGVLCQLSSSNNNNVLLLKGNNTTNGAWLGTDNTDAFIVSNGASVTERLRVDSSGRLLVGTSSSRGGWSGFTSAIDQKVQIEGTSFTDGLSLVRNENTAGAPSVWLGKSRSTSVGGNGLVASGDFLGLVTFQGADGTKLVEAANIAALVDGTPGANDMPGRLVFSVTRDGQASPTETLRISNGGQAALFSTTNNYVAYTSQGAGTTNWLFYGGYGSTSITSATTQSFGVYTNGNVVNTNNSYGALSDAKLKENIVDANSQWDDIKALQVRNYNLKEGQTHTQIGLIAQEVELVSPGLVSESPDRDEDGNDLGTVTKSVNYSVLYMKAVKALQEAMERIEVLEQRLTDAGIA